MEKEIREPHTLQPPFRSMTAPHLGHPLTVTPLSFFHFSKASFCAFSLSIFLSVSCSASSHTTPVCSHSPHLKHTYSNVKIERWMRKGTGSQKGKEYGRKGLIPSTCMSGTEQRHWQPSSYSFVS